MGLGMSINCRYCTLFLYHSIIGYHTYIPTDPWILQKLSGSAFCILKGHVSIMAI